MGELRAHNRALVVWMKQRYVCSNERRAKRNSAPYIVDGSSPNQAHDLSRIARAGINNGDQGIEQGIHDPQRRASGLLGKAILVKSNFPILIGFGAEIRNCVIGAGYSEFLMRLENV